MNKSPFNLSEFVKLTCWISMVFLLWMWILEIIPITLISVIAFAFFLSTQILVIADGRKRG